MELFNQSSWPVNSGDLPVLFPHPSPVLGCIILAGGSKLSFSCLHSKHFTPSHLSSSLEPNCCIVLLASLESHGASPHPFWGTPPALSVTSSDGHHLLAAKPTMSLIGAHLPGAIAEEKSTQSRVVEALKITTPHHPSCTASLELQ